jgi:hypothetical protein
VKLVVHSGGVVGGLVTGISWGSKTWQAIADYSSSNIRSMDLLVFALDEDCVPMIIFGIHFFDSQDRKPLTLIRSK